MAWLTRSKIGALLLAAVAIPANAASDALESARALAAANKWDEVVATLEEHLRFQLSAPEVDDLLGQALARVGRRDEAAFHFARALEALPDGDREASRIRKRLVEIDPFTSRREAAFKKVVKTLLDSAKTLQEGGHAERSLAILERLRRIAQGAELAEITALAERIRSATEKVDLDKSGDVERPSEGWPLLSLESKRYLLQAKLEPAVAEQLGRTMDEIFEYYIKIYFDGDASRVQPRKATIHIHSSHSDMAKSWEGGAGSAPAGWWSPGDWEVHAYDTRSDSGTLDQMLETLFHEASHHFMTMLAGGGGTPAWLNEGTASFFEGASAMADGRVLWPDAATGRLQHLNMMLSGDSRGGDAPSFLDVISYNQPGSYPGEYYPWGWGIVYFLQQYEDPDTLEHSHRPLYIEYRDEIIKRSGDPRELFERVFTGRDKHPTVAAFASDWKRWIQSTIYPLHFGAQKRELRMAEVQRYLDAAEAAAALKKKAKVSEEELLLRALGHIEYVRTRIDKPDTPDASLLLLQSDVLERVGRGASAAPLLEVLLEMAGDGRWETDEETLEKLVKRLSKLDSKNSALRIAQARAKNLGRSALDLIRAYEQSKTPLLLRTYTFAASMASALGDASGLEPLASELRTRARESGLLRGAIYRLGADAGAWKTIFTNQETGFSPAPGRIEIEGVRPVGRLCTATAISGEYEVRARITRVGGARTGAHHGLIVCGTTSGDWLVVTIDHAGKLHLKRMLYGVGNGVSDVSVRALNLREPPPEDQPFDFVAHVSPSGEIEVTIGTDGPYPFEAPLAIPAVGHVGVYVKYGKLLVEDAVIEILP